MREGGEGTYIFIEGGLQPEVSIVAGVGEGRNALLEVVDEAVLVEELLVEAGGVGLEGRDPGGDGHGRYLAGEIELLVRVCRYDGQYLVREMEVHIALACALLLLLLRHCPIGLAALGSSPSLSSTH